MMRLARQVFASPYPLLPLAVFAFFVLCFALHPLSPFYTHHLADPDDYMRLNQVIGWLQGQGWYDLSVPRLSPGAHTVVHWSRLIDLPIALVAWPLISCIGVANAVLVAALIVPLLWLLVLLELLPALARILIGRDHANLVCIAVLFAPLLLFNYTPGRVDHHDVQAIIAGFGLLGLGRIVTGERGWLFAICTAFIFACGFWIGAEALPWVILFIACLSIAAAWYGGTVARHAAVFGLCLLLFTAALIPMALPVSAFYSRALSWFSPAYMIFSALAGMTLVFGWFVGRYTLNRFLRLTFYAACAFAAAMAFFALIPSALNGPFTDYDTFDATTALDNIGEAQPLILSLHINRWMPMTFVAAGMTFARLLALPLAAFFFSLWSTKHARAEMRFVWLTQAVFLLAAIALTVFWQRRVGVFMELFTLAPLTGLLCAWWNELKWGLWDRPLFWAEIAVFLLLGPLPVILLPALVAHSPLYPDILLFPAARAATPCALEPILPFLNGPGGKKLTILNTGDTGPQLLFATPHNVIAGNFDVAGNADAYAFFHATDDAQALVAARKWKADTVLVCRHAPTLYLGSDYYARQHNMLKPGKDGLLHIVNTDRDQPLIARLTRGEAPGWLKPVEIPETSDYLMFTIQYPAGKK